MLFNKKTKEHLNLKAILIQIKFPFYLMGSYFNLPDTLIGSPSVAACLIYFYRF